MVQVTFFSTSKPVIDKKTDDYPDIISNNIEKDMQSMDPEAEVNCATHIENNMAIIAGEVEADSSIDASKVVRKTINRLFNKNSLYPKA